MTYITESSCCNTIYWSRQAASNRLNPCTCCLRLLLSYHQIRRHREKTISHVFFLRSCHFPQNPLLVDTNSPNPQAHTFVPVLISNISYIKRINFYPRPHSGRQRYAFEVSSLTRCRFQLDYRLQKGTDVFR